MRRRFPAVLVAAAILLSASTVLAAVADPVRIEQGLLAGTVEVLQRSASTVASRMQRHQ